jgi:hypothetical protein
VTKEQEEVTEMRKRITAVALMVAISSLLIMPSAFAQPLPAGSGITVPITGTFTDAVGGVGRFVGSLNIQRFALDNNNQIVAVGTLTGTLTDSLGNVLGSIVNTISLILNQAATRATCEILHLELGPLDLNLLGLVVHLNKVVLDISAQAGPGDLLGNLLCSVAHLLDQGGALQNLVNLLNQILALL